MRDVCPAVWPPRPRACHQHTLGVLTARKKKKGWGTRSRGSSSCSRSSAGRGPRENGQGKEGKGAWREGETRRRGKRASSLQMSPLSEPLVHNLPLQSRVESRRRIFSGLVPSLLSHFSSQERAAPRGRVKCPTRNRLRSRRSHRKPAATPSPVLFSLFADGRSGSFGDLYFRTIGVWAASAELFSGCTEVFYSRNRSLEIERRVHAGEIEIGGCVRLVTLWIIGSSWRSYVDFVDRYDIG